MLDYSGAFSRHDSLRYTGRKDHESESAVEQIEACSMQLLCWGSSPLVQGHELLHEIADWHIRRNADGSETRQPW